MEMIATTTFLASGGPINSVENLVSSKGKNYGDGETLSSQILFGSCWFRPLAVLARDIQGRWPRRFSAQSVPVHQSRFLFPLSLLVPFTVHLSRLSSSRTALRSS